MMAPPIDAPLSGRQSWQKRLTCRERNCDVNKRSDIIDRSRSNVDRSSSNNVDRSRSNNVDRSSSNIVDRSRSNNVDRSRRNNKRSTVMVVVAMAILEVMAVVVVVVAILEVMAVVEVVAAATMDPSTCAAEKIGD
jgi:hypothetical protein